MSTVSPGIFIVVYFFPDDVDYLKDGKWESRNGCWEGDWQQCAYLAHCQGGDHLEVFG